MNISGYIEEFVKKNHRYKTYSRICNKLLTGGLPYSLNSRASYEESEYLPFNIRECVMAYTSTKDTAIELFKDLVSFLNDEKGITIPEIKWPPVPISNTFERLMFIAKFLQDKENRISRLPDRMHFLPSG